MLDRNLIVLDSDVNILPRFGGEEQTFEANKVDQFVIRIGVPI